MSRPDWEVAPDWAQWVAQDGHPEEHTYVWFEKKPGHDDVNAWLPVDGGRWSVTRIGDFNPDWRETLERRP